jgi:uncharacterized protein (DUF2141 family)
MFFFSQFTARRQNLAARLLFAAIAGPLCALPAQAADLTVVVKNIQSGAGNVMLGLFDSATSFPKTVAKGVQIPAATRDAAGRVTLVLRDLAPGQYAFSAYHDLNGNGQLDSNLMGLPTEPYGFSNNARGSFGPPSFQAAGITLPAQGLSLELPVQ